MDYEKAYKKALERAREELGSGSFDRGSVEYIFPELKESEDERIRKEFCKDIWTYIPNEKAHKYIAWLEKQAPKKWSEEDESKVEDVIYFLDTAKTHYASTKALDDCIEWLKSLKQRMKE